MTDEQKPKKPTNVKSIRPEIKVETEDDVKVAEPHLLTIIEKFKEQVVACNITEFMIVGVGSNDTIFRATVGASTKPFLMASLIATEQALYNENRVFPFTAPEQYEFIEDYE